MSKITIISAKELLKRILDTEINISESIIPFLKDEHNKVDGVFRANQTIFIIYSKVITPAELESSKKIGIFQSLKLYASSGKYKGLIDEVGKSILPNIYLSIEPFMNDILKVKSKGHKFGLIRISGDIILPIVYDRIDSLGELVFAVCKDGKLGFMNLKGEEVIPFMYEVPNEEVVFNNGLACVLKKNEDGKFRYGYIDHTNQVVFSFDYDYYRDFNNSDTVENDITYNADDGESYTRESYELALDGSRVFINSEHFEDNSWITEWGASTAGRHQTYYDDCWLDAFEGDASNRWNID